MTEPEAGARRSRMRALLPSLGLVLLAWVLSRQDWHALSGAFAPAGDGSAMEAGGGVRVLPLLDAIAACRAGDVPDMKTEVALLRLADAIGYVPSLDRFVEDLPADLRARFAPPGLERLP